jgi:hypothetical protein
MGSGTHLLSHTVSSVVPSAAQVLTIVFGMGTGVSPERIGTGNIRVAFEKCRFPKKDRWKWNFHKSFIWNLCGECRDWGIGTIPKLTSDGCSQNTSALTTQQ